MSNFDGAEKDQSLNFRKHLLFQLFILLSGCLIGQNQFTGIQPKPAGVLFDSSVVFSWNVSSSASLNTNYHLKVSSDSLFNSIVYTGNTNQLSDTLTFSAEGNYYWKVEVHRNGNNITETVNYGFTIASIYNLPNNNLLYLTDTGLVLTNTNEVARWTNLADTSLSAVQATDSLKPLIVDNVVGLNSNKAIRFDGTDDRLSVFNAVGLAEIYTIANWSGASPFNSLKGMITGRIGSVMFRAQASTTNFGPSQVFNNAIYINNILSNNFAPLNNYKLVSGRIAGTFPISNGLLFGSDFLLAGRFWQGDIGDVIGFQSPISDSTRQIVNSYFCNKYGRQLNLGNDILPVYGVCDTVYSVDSTYSSYLWSNGDTTSFSTLLQGQRYELTVTNEFGCQYVDDIYIGSLFNDIDDFGLCPADSFAWNTNLPGTDYTFQWSDMSSDSALIITQAGDYSVLVTDTNGCQLQSDTVSVVIDTTLNSFSLGADTMLCQGSTIGVLSTTLPITSYLWSTGDTTPTINADTAGNYIVEVFDGNCRTTDTINVGIQGIAPDGNFSFENIFFGDSVVFTDLSTPPVNDSIVVWRWYFGDATTSTLRHPKHQYNTTGTYTVSLYIEVSGGCSDSVIKTITIRPRPPIVNENPFQNLFTGIYPKPSGIVYDSTIIFNWSASGLASAMSNYVLQISNDSSFSSIVYTKNTNQLSDTVSFSQEGLYYWKVEVYENGIKQTESVTYDVTASSLYNLPNINLLFLTDTGLVLTNGNEVSQWTNLADTTRNAIQATAASRPLLIDNVSLLDSNKVVRFDGINDHLSILSSVGVSELYTLANWSGSSPFNSLKGLITGRLGGTIWRTQSFTTNFGPSQVFPSSIYINHVNTSNFAPLNEYKFVSGRINGTFPISSGLLFGSDFLVANRYWEGDLAEIIGFSSPLTDSTRNIVESYFCNKYGKPLDLGADIQQEYGFCDTVIQAEFGYSSYQWSNGDTTNIIQALPGNRYELTVTDEFGCQFHDDIFFEIPLGRIEDQLLCLGDSFVWNTHLSPSIYDYRWSDLSTDSLLNITQAGDYFVLVGDTNGCRYMSDTVEIRFDTSLSQFSLGADTMVCKGSVIGLFNSSLPITTYLWSTGDTTPTIIIDSADTYILTISNGMCIASDTINVGLSGIPPTANFRFENTFFLDTVSFTDLSIPSVNDSIVLWRWDFGDTSVSTMQHPTHYYDSSGRYNVSLYVELLSGCSDSIVKEVVIRIRPPIVNEDSLQNRFTGLYPKPNDVVFDSEVIMSWNESVLADTNTSYVLKVATDSLFTNSVHIRSTTGLRDTVLLNQEARYYWKVEVLRAANKLTETNDYSFTVSNLLNLPGINMLLMSDTGLVLTNTNQVERWINLADTSLSAEEFTDSLKPLLVDSLGALNNKGAIRFDGRDDRLSITSSIGIAELFTIANWNGSSPFNNIKGLITGRLSSIMLRAQSFTTRFGPSQVFPNAVYVNNVPTFELAPINEYKLIHGRINGTFQIASGLLFGSDLLLNNRFWDGDIAEVIGFSTPLSDSTRKIVLAHICNKYGSPLDLGNDIEQLYGFCDTIVQADTAYSSYLWSNGDTNSFTRIIPGRTYELTVTDNFGCEYTDDIYFESIINRIEDTTLCLMDSFIWDTKLSTADYSFQWNTTSIDSMILIDQEGGYYVLIEDTNGCRYQSDTLSVSFDSSLVSLSLGPDTAVCKEDFITVRGVSVPISYSWSTGNQSPFQSIDTAGIYTIEVNNGRCLNRDTALISIKGAPPIVNFTFKDVCVFDSTILSDLTIPLGPDTLVIWRWDFDDNTQLFGDTVKKRFTNTGSETISLTVTTNQGCVGDTIINIPIYPNPTADFEIFNKCSKSPINFFDRSSITAGSIVSYVWNFGDTASTQNNSILQNPMHTFDTMGTYDINLIVMSNQSCLDTVTISKLVNPTPNPAFRFEGNCLNDSIYFFDESILPVGNIIDYLWIVDVPPNDQHLKVMNPVVMYDFAGRRPMVLRVTSDSLCEDTVRGIIEIFENPIAAFTIDTVCQEVPFTIMNTSTSLDSISLYRYIYDNRDTSFLENPTYVEDTADTYSVSLFVQSINGCVDSTTQQMMVNPKPQASFKLLTNNTGIPFNVPIENNSQGGASYIWSFGNGDSLQTMVPDYTYQDTGTYTIKLEVTSSFGCIDSTNREIIALPTFIDAALDRIILNENSQGDLEIFARIINNGFNTIEELRLVADINNEFQFKETFTDVIYTGESRGYDFSSAFIQERGRKVDFLCVRIETVNGGPDSIITNNELCERAFNNELLFKLYPNPVENIVTLEYVLPQEGKVSVRFFDATGRLALKEFELMQEDGYYQTMIPVNSLNPGLYHYKFTHNGVEKSGTFMKR